MPIDRVNFFKRRYMAQRACMATLAVVTLLLTTQWSLAERRSKGQVTATWQRQALGKALTRLAASQEIPLWLDRRVDPQQTIDSQFTDFSVEKVLDELAKKKGLSWVWFGGTGLHWTRWCSRRITPFDSAST